MFDLVKIGPIRSLAWRLGRRLYCWARRDVANDPASNGEYWLIETILGLTRATAGPAVLIDIGANQGNWTAYACNVLDGLDGPGTVYAFEPTQSTFDFLFNRFRSDRRVKPNRLALTEWNGQAEFFVVRALAGTNSLHNVQGASPEKVQTRRLDDFLKASSVTAVTLVKSDTEGHDMSVLRGAQESLCSGAIEAWQFEYNHRWVANHSMLKDVFDFIEDKPYKLGKLFGNGLEIYLEWHPELERFFEGNFVLVRNDSSLRNYSSIRCFDSSNVAARSM